MTTIAAYTINGLTRPELTLDPFGNIVLDDAATAFAQTYGLRALYLGCPPNTPYPPVQPSLLFPGDTNGADNTVAEGAAANTTVGITAHATSLLGFPITYSLTGDSSGGGFKINPSTGVVSVADPNKIDFESSPGHSYSITVRANDGILTTTRTFTIDVSDIAPSTPADANGAANTVAEGAANGTAVGVTVSATDVNGGTVTYSLTNNANGAFAINSTTGVITVADSTKIDFETAVGHAYTVTARASDSSGASTTQNFTIGVSDVAPSTPIDSNAAANTVAEGAANGSTVGITASSVDPNGPATTYSLIDNAGGRFAINSSTGVVTVANGAAIDFETAAGHAYGIIVQATSGATSTTQAFSIGVTDVGPSAPTDANGAANAVLEGAANGTVVGITATSTDPGGGPAPTYSLTNSAGGRFAIDANTGIVTVANGAAIDFESAAGHAYGITVQAQAGALTTTQNFSIGVSNVNEAPAGTDHAVLIAEDTTYTFGVADFGFTDPSDTSLPNSLLAVKITTLPGAGEGTLTNNGVPVNAGDSVSATDIAAGHLVFTPVLNANGSPEATFTFQVQDNGGTANGGVDLDQSANTFTINVNAGNDAPINSVPGTQSVNEEATLTFSTGNGNAITISDVDIGSGNETVTLTVTGGTLALGSTAGLTSFTNNAASITLTGTVANVNAAMNGLTYTGNLNFNGADSLVVSTNDNGNTGAGGPQNDTDGITINVAPVNDNPVNGVPGAQTVNEDTNLVFSGANAITISDVDGGSGDETVTLTVASGTLALGSILNLTSFTNNAASITLTGTIANINTALDGLTYHGNLNFNGADSLSIVTHDNGNTGGGDLTDTDSVTINVSAVNDAPSFTVGGTQTVLEDSGAHTVNGFITGISPGPADEAGQTVNFLTSNDNNALFSAGPAIDANGNLTYTLAANANGSAIVTVQLHDNGGSANGGSDTSGAQTFTITAGPVNDAPAGGNNTFTILEDSARTFTAVDFGFTDPVDANTSGPNAFLAVKITTVPGAAGTLTNNGVVVNAGDTVLASDITSGHLVFTPAANVNGLPAPSFTFQVQDTGGTANGGVDLDQSANTIAFNVNPVNDAPDGTDTTISSVGDHTFTAAEFGFTDPADAAGAGGANAFQAVIITTIPDPATGDLKLNDVAVTAGQTIAVGDIGGLVFTPVLNNTGTFTFQVQDNGGTLNSGVDTDQSPNNLTIVQNAAPIIDSDGAGATSAVSAAENQTAVTTVHATDPDNGPVTPISYSIVGGDDQAKFAIDSSTGVLTFITAPDFENPTDTSTAGNNTYIVTVQAFDGVSVDQQTITITVTGVNDAPVITSNGGLATASINVNENSTAVATVTTTDQDNPAQTLSYSLAGGADQNKFSIDSSTGVLTFDTAPNFEVATDTGGDNGYDVIVRVTDNGAPNLHDDQAITVHVQNVNEAPDTGASTVTGNEDAASIAITITGTDVDAGDSVASFHITNIPNTGTQGTLYSDIGLTTQVTNGADVTATGNSATLYFKPSADFNTHAGAVTFNAAATDTHGLTDATAATETINVNAVDDAPLNNGVPANFVVGSGVTYAITGLSISDIDANEVGTPTDITTTLASGAGIVTIGDGASGTNAGIAGGATVTTNASGSVTLTGSITQINASLSASNGVVYTAADNAGNTTTTLTMTTNDHGHNGTGGPLTDVDTIQVGVIPQVWFIDADQSGADPTAPRGSQANPFGTVHEFNTSSGPGTSDYIYVKAGTYDGEGINLKAGQTLLGDDQALSFANPLNPSGPAIVIEDAAGARPTIHVTTAGDQAIDLSTGNTIAGIDIQTNAGTTGLDDGVGVTANAVGSLNVSHMAISGAGQSVDIGMGGTLNVTLDSAASTGGANGISLTSTSGTFHSHGGTLSGASGADVALNGGTVNFTHDGAINDGTGTVVSIANMTGGTQDFNGSITGGSIALSSNTGATMSFDGGMTLSTGASNAFSATGGGTVTVTGTNHLTTTTGTALNISNTTIGSADVTFQDISSNGASSGIILNNTGSIGSFSVTGNGASTSATQGTIAGSLGTGGTIQNTSGNAISITDVGGGVTLKNMIIGDSAATAAQNADTVNNIGGAGVFITNSDNLVLENVKIARTGGSGIEGGTIAGGSNVTGLSLSNVAILNAGDGAGDDGIDFNANGAGGSDPNAGNQLDGTFTITNSVIAESWVNNVFVSNRSGTLNATFTNTTFGANSDSNDANDSVLLDGHGTANINATITNSAFTAGRGDLLQFVGSSTSGNNSLTLTNNQFSNNYPLISSGAGGVTLTGGSSGTTTFNIQNNTFRDSLTNALSIAKSVKDGSAPGDANSVLDVTISNNTIGLPGTANSGSLEGSGISITHQGGGTLRSTIHNNDIYQYNNFGISLQTGTGAVSNGTLIAEVTGNLVSNPGNNANIGSPFQGFVVNGGVIPGDNYQIYVTLGGDGAMENDFTDSGRNGGFDVRLRARQDSTIHLTADNAAGSAVYSYAGGPADLTALNAFIALHNLLTTQGHVTNSPPGPGFVGGAPPPLLAASGGVQASSPSPGETHLTQAQLDSVVVAAIAQWAHAGASAAQLAMMSAIVFTVANLSGRVAGEHIPGHIFIDDDAAGHGWFVDPTPSDNSEFTHAANAAGTDLYTDPTTAAAGHLDLLTTVVHEMGHELGLPDLTAVADAGDLMHIDLVDGERRVPDATDVAHANAPGALQAEAALPLSAQAAVGTPIVVGTAGNDTIDAGHGGNILVGGAGADHFVFANVEIDATTPWSLMSSLWGAPPVTPPALTHVADYSFAQGDSFDFSALTSAFHGSWASDAQIVRAVEDPSGTFATLQVNAKVPWGFGSWLNGPSNSTASWVNVAQLDGVHAGDDISVLIDSHAAVHVAHLHAGLLV